MLVLVFGMGLVAGVTVLSAQAERRRQRFSSAAASGGSACCWPPRAESAPLSYCCGVAAILQLVRAEPTTYRAPWRRGHLGMLAPGMPAILMFIATSSFLESIRQTAAGHDRLLSPPNIVNPRCAGSSCSENSTAGHGRAGRGARPHRTTRWCMLAAIVGYALALPERDITAYRARACRPLPYHRHAAAHWRRWRSPCDRNRSHSPPLTMLAGWLGNDALAAYQDAIRRQRLRVHAGARAADGDLGARGRCCRPQRPGRPARLAGWVGAGLNVGLLAAVGVVIWFSRDAIAAVFTSNPVVHAPLVSAALVWSPSSASPTDCRRC